MSLKRVNCTMFINKYSSARHKTNANYYGNLVSDKIEKRVVKNLLCDSCLTLDVGLKMFRMTNSLSLFSILYHTLNFHNWHLFCVLQSLLLGLKYSIIYIDFWSVFIKVHFKIMKKINIITLNPKLFRKKII